MSEPCSEELAVTYTCDDDGVHVECGVWPKKGCGWTRNLGFFVSAADVARADYDHKTGAPA